MAVIWIAVVNAVPFSEDPYWLDDVDISTNLEEADGGGADIRNYPGDVITISKDSNAGQGNADGDFKCSFN